MRSPLLVLLVVASIASWETLSSATVNPDPDEIGVYFDTDADSACMTVGPSVPFFAYLIITNPSSAEVRGIEFSMCTEVVGGNEGLLFRLGEVWFGDFIDLGIVYDWCLDGRMIGFFDPVPQVGENVVIVQLQYMLLADLGVKFFIGPHPVESITDGLPAYLGADDVIVPLSVSSGDMSLPVAEINGECSVVSTESMAFSGLKCLYR